MYRAKDRSENYLFEELMPFGGQLAEGNRWLKIKGLISWGELEREYASYFSGRGRPGLDGRLVIGLFLLKHMTVLSDVGVVLELQENVYWQAFCGMEQFETGKQLDPSSLTKIRHKLGPKVCLSHVDGFTFLDEFGHENYSEARVDIVEKQIENYEERFGHKPPSMTGDQLYGNRENRELLKTQGIRSAFKPLGRKTEANERQERYLRRKQRERNRIEGDIGNAKEHYGLDGIRYHYREGSEMWVRMGLLAKNLKAAMTRMALSPTG